MCHGRLEYPSLVAVIQVVPSCAAVSTTWEEGVSVSEIKAREKSSDVDEQEIDIEMGGRHNVEDATGNWLC